MAEAAAQALARSVAEESADTAELECAALRLAHNQELDQAQAATRDAERRLQAELDGARTAQTGTAEALLRTETAQRKAELLLEQKLAAERRYLTRLAQQRWAARQTSAALEAWTDHSRQRARQRQVVRRALAALRRRGIRCALLGWHEHMDRQRRNRRVVLRIVQRRQLNTVASALRSWREGIVHARDRQLRTSSTLLWDRHEVASARSEGFVERLLRQHLVASSQKSVAEYFAAWSEQTRANGHAMAARRERWAVNWMTRWRLRSEFESWAGFAAGCRRLRNLTARALFACERGRFKVLLEIVAAWRTCAHLERTEHVLTAEVEGINRAVAEQHAIEREYAVVRLRKRRESHQLSFALHELRQHRALHRTLRNAVERRHTRRIVHLWQVWTEQCRTVKVLWSGAEGRVQMVRRRWEARQTSEALEAWIGHTRQLARQRQVVRRALTALRRRGIRCALLGWHEHVDRQKRYRRVVLRIVQRRQLNTIGFMLRSWREEIMRARDRQLRTSSAAVWDRHELAKEALFSHVADGLAASRSRLVVGRSLMVCLAGWHEVAKGSSARRQRLLFVVRRLQSLRLGLALSSWVSISIDRQAVRINTRKAVLFLTQHSLAAAMGDWSAAVAAVRRCERTTTLAQSLTSRRLDGLLSQVFSAWTRDFLRDVRQREAELSARESPAAAAAAVAADQRLSAVEGSLQRMEQRAVAAEKEAANIAAEAEVAAKAASVVAEARTADAELKAAEQKQQVKKLQRRLKDSVLASSKLQLEVKRQQGQREISAARG